MIDFEGLKIMPSKSEVKPMFFSEKSFMERYLSQYTREAYGHKERKGYPQIA